MTGPFSSFVTKALVDTITGGGGNDLTPPIGIYRSGPKIEQFFLDCGIDMRIGASSRLPATTEALRQAARQWDGDERIKRVILKVCDPREYLAEPEKAAAVRQHINRVLEPDGLAVAIVAGKAHLTERLATGVIVEPFIAKVDTLDFDTVQGGDCPRAPISERRSRGCGHRSMFPYRGGMPLHPLRAETTATREEGH